MAKKSPAFYLLYRWFSNIRSPDTDITSRSLEALGAVPRKMIKFNPGLSQSFKQGFLV